MPPVLNSYAMLHRERKAAKLADAIAACGLTSDQLEFFSDATWASAEAAAGVKPASEETRKTVREFLERREQAVRKRTA